MRRIYIPFFLLAFLIAINYNTIAQSTNISGPAGSEYFGNNVTILTNGNYVVADPYFDDGPIQNVGAVYLYNGSTHTLISILKGSTAEDLVGSRVTALNNGNYVVSSPDWNNGPVAYAGAVTWCSGITGLNAVVSSSNSLVGSTELDQIGLGINYSGVTALNNGNYVIQSPNWNNGAITKAGAVTWGNGITGITGVVSSSNSLVGSTADDQVGLASDHYTYEKGIITLQNGNYVVNSLNWDNGANVDAGAVTWGNGNTGISGVLSISNSLVGNNTNNLIGSNGIYELSNGNYVISSPFWTNGTIDGAGASTWCNGNTGLIGEISIFNSLVGSNFMDFVGGNYESVIELTNGNYIVSSPIWNNGTFTKVGAATWANGLTGISGEVNSSNSLVGSSENDQIGDRIVALSNGNYVVCSPNWKNGALTYAGAATWGNGSTGITGLVSSNNSLIGTKAGDYVGNAIALTNGNYVVTSEQWDNGAIVNAGAATLANGTTGIVGEVSISNSLIGSKANDNVGSHAVALSNGNYVISSPNWDNGPILNVGAATWGNGNTGITGEINSGNSLVGAKANDQISRYSSMDGIYALSNGNYVVISVDWQNGTKAKAGAVTWGNGNIGITGEVSTSNSLVGANTNDYVGLGGVTELSNGNYIINSYWWSDGPKAKAGAATWCNGNTGITGLVSSSNSLIGNSDSDQVGYFVYTLPNGDYTTITPYYRNTATYALGAVTWGNGATGITGLLTSCNSVLAISNRDQYYFQSIYNPIYGYIIVGQPADNIITIYKPTSVALANSLDAVNENIQGISSVPLITNSGCRIIAVLNPNGANAVSGVVDAKVWIEPSVPNYSNKPFVARHYQISPATNPSTATGRITLYFTQQEFNDFNAHPGSALKLPVNSADATGKANLRIGKYNGLSNDGSGLPASYSAGSIVINPDDADIVWNTAQSRWEVSFDVTGFSGFIVQTSSSALPLTLLEFNGRLQNDNALLNWKTTNEHNTQSFDVERSTDGISYSFIGNVRGANSSGIHNYTFTDNNVSTLGVPIIYYRLKQIDIDSRFVYSRIIALSVENKNMVLLYPNPTINELNLAVTISKGEQALIKIIDNLGRVVKQKQVYLSTGITSLSIDLSGLSKGTYYLELKGEDINERKSFIKQ